MRSLKEKIPEMEKTKEEYYIRDGYPRIPSIFRDQRSVGLLGGGV
jgi:hypothetical protein